MGSTTDPLNLPSSSSSSLILTNPSPAERIKTWTLTHPNWGPALTLDDYLSREAYLMTVPLAKDGGITHWILTEAGKGKDEQVVLSSCESLRRRALVAMPSPDGTVEMREGLAHGIASVFTEERFRGRGYAGRMMAELGPILSRWQAGPAAAAATDGRCLFSVLFSDIGKTFYARRGWAVYESRHLAFPPTTTTAAAAAAAATADASPPKVEDKQAAIPFGYHELASLCADDEALLRTRLRDRAAATRKTCAALAPDLDTMLWHLMREDFVTKHIFGRTPAIKGAVYGTIKGRRMWAVWTRAYLGGKDKAEGNTLYILRFVVEDEGEDGKPDGNDNDDELVRGFKAIIDLARAQAAEWKSADVQMWNPSPLLTRLAHLSGLDYDLVEREKDSIPSLMWYGGGSVEDVEWVANEKFGWC